MAIKQLRIYITYLQLLHLRSSAIKILLISHKFIRRLSLCIIYAYNIRVPRHRFKYILKVHRTINLSVNGDIESPKGGHPHKSANRKGLESIGASERRENKSDASRKIFHCTAESIEASRFSHCAIHITRR